MKKKVKVSLATVVLGLLVFLIFALTDCFSISESSLSQPEQSDTTQEVVITNPSITVQPTSGTVWYEVYFTSPSIPFDQQYSGGIENHLIYFINSAQKSVYLAGFEFSIDSLTEALIEAAGRGVDVRIVYDSEHADINHIDRVRKAGIPAIPDNRSAYMHNKFVIVDGKCVWTGSFNFSLNAAYRNNENAVYLCSLDVAENYTQEFLEMFAGEFGAGSPSDTPHPVLVVNGIEIKNYFAPEDDVMEKVLAEVNQAQESIHFMVFSFTDDDLGTLIIQKAAAGVLVEGIFESTGASTEYSECNRLLQSGISVMLDGNPRVFHHKVIVIDGETVIFGSFNFTANADKQNDENILIIHDAGLAQQFEMEYQRMKLLAVPPEGDSCLK